MQKDKNFIVAIDAHTKPKTEDVIATLEKASALSKTYSAEIRLVYCDIDPLSADKTIVSNDNNSEIKARFFSKQEEWLSEIIEPFLSKDVKIKKKIMWYQPFYEGIIKEVLKNDSSLLMKPVRRYPKIAKALYANTDWQLMRYCPVPLLLVKNDPWLSPMKIAAAVDPAHAHDKPSNLDHKILSVSKKLSDTLNAELHVIHSVNIDLVSYLGKDKLMYQRKKQLDKLIENYGIKKEHVHLVPGKPGSVIPKTIKEIDADFAVMGAVSRSSMSRIFVGHTAEQILEDIPSDALIVKMSSFQTHIKA